MCRRTSSESILTVTQPAQTVSSGCRHGETQNVRLSQGLTRPTCCELDKSRERVGVAFDPEGPPIESGWVLGNIRRTILLGSTEESRRRRARRVRECLCEAWSARHVVANEFPRHTCESSFAEIHSQISEHTSVYGTCDPHWHSVSHQSHAQSASTNHNKHFTPPGRTQIIHLPRVFNTLHRLNIENIVWHTRSQLPSLNGEVPSGSAQFSQKCAL
jgi:hypothetical protein